VNRKNNDYEIFDCVGEKAGVVSLGLILFAKKKNCRQWFFGIGTEVEDAVKEVFTEDKFLVNYDEVYFFPDEKFSKEIVSAFLKCQDGEGNNVSQKVKKQLDKLEKEYLVLKLWSLQTDNEFKFLLERPAKRVKGTVYCNGLVCIKRNKRSQDVLVKEASVLVDIANNLISSERIIEFVKIVSDLKTPPTLERLFYVQKENLEKALELCEASLKEEGFKTELIKVWEL